MAKPKLKPCPFCGSEKINVYGWGILTEIEIVCETCGARMPSENLEKSRKWNITQAARAWNKRAE